MRFRAKLRHAAFQTHPARFLAFGYLTYMLVGWLLLMLPVMQTVPVGALDALFIAVSAVSTTGLVTIDPGTSFSLAGQGVIALLILAGGLGYMTIGSFAVLMLRHRLSGYHQRGTRLAFNLPDGLNVPQFLRAVVVFSLTIQCLGAVLLYPLFRAEGVANPAWQAVFHAVSAFCTAGFSLFPTSMEAFVGNPGINIVIGALSILGALGFIVVVDLWQRIRGEGRALAFSSTVILRMTLLLVAAGTLFLRFGEPAIAALPASDRWWAAFFQAMTASTTVGFDTVPIGGIGGAAALVLIVLMLIGASPAGTGGGLKTTSVATVLAVMVSAVRGRRDVVLFGHRLHEDRIRLAVAGLSYYLLLILVSGFALLLLEPGTQFEQVLFEAISALSTVGLSMGITAGLSDAGKIVLILLMYAGRVGILTFAIAFALRGAADDENPQEADLVL